MARRISTKTKRLIEELYAQNLPRAKIAQRANVSYSTVHVYTKFRKSINPDTGQPYTSQSEYRDRLVRQQINPETNQPYESRNQLRNYQARQRINPETKKPFASLSQLLDYQAKQRINPETEKPFASLRELRDYRVRQRASSLENRILSDLIKRRLEELRKRKSQLAREVGVSREAVSNWARGESTPHGELLERLYSALKVPYKTLDDLLKGVGYKTVNS